MNAIVGVTLPSDDDRSDTALPRARMTAFFRRAGRLAGGVRVLAIDRHTLTPELRAKAFDCEKEITFDLSLPSTLDLLHVFKLGHASSRSLSLAQKWAELETWLRALDDRGVRCVNPVKTLVYGLSKEYLFDLEAAGLPIVPTTKIPSAVSLEQLRAACGECYRIVKPINGECGRLVHRLDDVDEAVLEAYRRATDTLLLQPFVPEIYDGERSLLFLGDRLSHAAKKTPGRGEFRANDSSRGATVRAYSPTRAEIELGFRVRDRFARPLDTFRLDLVGPAESPRIVEVEAVDPGHYCRFDQTHAERMADFYLRLLERG
ncbi:MAG: hypothetical protein KDD11_01345 [Acidobacteria bacterium]|nr:hypothetical protein [Acidobacteriota bacterium]